MVADGWTTARITHIAVRQAWVNAQSHGTYEPASFADEGFIHCSTPWQVARIACAAFPARDDLVLLIIDPSQLGTTVVFENCEGGIEPFPHVYESLPIAAVDEVVPLRWDASTRTYDLPRFA